jgi:hypothetical protein
MSILEYDGFEDRFPISALERRYCGTTARVGCFVGGWERAAVCYAL